MTNFLPGDLGLSQKAGQFLFGGAAIRHGIFQREIVDGPAKLMQQFVAAFKVAFKGVQPFVIPARQNFLRAVREKGHMDLDVLLLADAIQPANTLFE